LRRTFYTYFLLFVVTLLKPFSNLFFAGGLKSFGRVLSANPIPYVIAMRHPLVASAIALQILWLLCRMILLSRADLSFVLPATASGYVLSALLGWTFLAERITLVHWAGIFLIFAGSSFVGMTRPNTTKRSRAFRNLDTAVVERQLSTGNIAE
jgi:drug/metabolite transporter (DMT)-like permease